MKVEVDSELQKTMAYELLRRELENESRAPLVPKSAPLSSHAFASRPPFFPLSLTPKDASSLAFFMPLSARPVDRYLFIYFYFSLFEKVEEFVREGIIDPLLNDEDV